MSPTADPTARLPSSRARVSHRAAPRRTRGPGRARVRNGCRSSRGGEVLRAAGVREFTPGEGLGYGGPRGRGARESLRVRLRGGSRTRLQRHHPVGDRQQRRTVDDQQHGPPGGQPPYGVDDARLALAVQARGRLVQQQDRPVGEERPGQGEALALARGEPGAVLAERRPRPVGQCRDEVVRARVPQRREDRLVVGVGPGEADVLGDRVREEVGALGDPGDPVPPAFEVQLREVPAPDPDAPLVGYGEPEDHVQQGGLADPARADQGDGLPRLHGERRGVQRRFGAALVAYGHLRQLQAQRVRHVLGTRGAGFGLQDREDLLGGREALGRRVVLRPDLADRQIRLRGQDQDHQTGVEVEFTVDEAHADRDGDERHRQGRQQLQGEGGEEGDPQGAQGGAAVVGGDGADRRGLGLGPPEDLQGRQPGDDVQEVPGEPGQQLPLPVHPGLGGPADQDHEQRDERQGDDDDRRRHPVLGDDPGEHRHRHDDREAELREVAGEVVVERVDAPGRQGDQRTGALSAQPVGAQSRRPLQEQAAQFRLDGRAGAMGRQFGEPGDQGPSERDGDEQQERGTQRGDREPALEAAHHDLGDEHRLGDHQQGADQAESHHGRQEEAGGPCVVEQTRIDRFHVKHPPGGVGELCGIESCHEPRGPRQLTGVSARRRCAGCRCACGRPSRSSSGRAARWAWRCPRTRS